MTAQAPPGRSVEFGKLADVLIQAAAGKGGTILLTGEPGIGKTRLVKAFLDLAKDSGAVVLYGGSSADSAEPFHAFSSALGSLLPAGLFSQRKAVRFERILAIDSDGTVIASHPQEGSADGIAATIAAVQGFVKDSFQTDGEGLGRLEFGGTKVIIGHGARIFIAGVVAGEASEEMRERLRAAAVGVEARYGGLLKGWPGEASDVTKIAGDLRILAETDFFVRKELEGATLEGERARIAEAIARALGEAAGAHPAALVVEDMHWADAGSLYVLSYLARNAGGARLAILATGRASEGRGFVQAREAMLAEETATELALTGLAPEGVRELVEGMYNPNAFDSSFFGRIAEDSKGNPLFVVEALRQLEHEGGIVRDGDTYVIAKGDYSIPSSVEEVVRRRLDSLEPDALAMAEYAACAGGDFELGAALSTESLAGPERAFEALSSSGIVVAERDRWRFSHALFHKVVYAGISARWLASHHRSLGAYYERTHVGREDEVIYELARHFRVAGDPAKALEYCERAGDKAAATLAVERALEFYEGALASLAGDERRRASLLGKAGEMEFRLGNADAALAKLTSAIEYGTLTGVARLQAANNVRLVFILKNDFARGLEAMEAAVAALSRANAEERADFLVELAMSYLENGRLDEGASKLSEAVALLPSIASPARRAAVRMAQGTVARTKNDYDAAERYMRDALVEAAKSGDPRVLAKAYSILGQLLHYKGEYIEAAELMEKSSEQSEKAGDVVALAGTVSNLGMVVSDSGDLEGSAAYLKRAAAIFRRIGALRGLASSLGNLGYTYAVMGRNDEALRYQQESLDIRQRLGSAAGIAWSRYDMSIVYDNMGRFEEAEECLRYCLQVWNPEKEPMGCSSAEGMLGRLMEKTGRLKEAKELYLRAIEHARVGDIKPSEFSAVASLVRLGEFSANEMMPRLEKINEKLNDSSLLLDLKILKSDMALRGGDVETALREAEEGLAVWKESKELALDPQAAELMMLRSRAKERAGDLSGAREDAESAIILLRARGRIWKASKEEERARTLA